MHVSLSPVSHSSQYYINNKTTRNLHFSSHQNVSQALQEIPETDKTQLEQFLRRFTKNQFFGHVLLGIKPSCIDGVSDAFKLFEKYKDKFSPFQNFIFRPQNIHGFNGAEPTPFLLFLNKQAALNVIKKDWWIFHDLVTPRFPDVSNPDKLLQKLESQNDVSTFVFSHEWLLGIMLGFGSHNAYLCHRKCQIDPETKLKKLSINDFQWFEKLNDIKPVQEMTSFYKNAHFQSKYLRPPIEYQEVVDKEVKESRINHIEQVDAFFKEYYNPLMEQTGIATPSFGGDESHPETQFLRNRYKEAAPKVKALFDSSHFLKDIYTLLTDAK